MLWDSWLRGESPKAIWRAFGKPSSLFIASWPPVLRRPVETTPQSRTNPVPQRQRVRLVRQLRFSLASLHFTAWSNALQKLPNRNRSNPTNDAAKITRDLRIEDPAREEAGDENVVSGISASVISNHRYGGAAASARQRFAPVKPGVWLCRRRAAERSKSTRSQQRIPVIGHQAAKRTTERAAVARAGRGQPPGQRLEKRAAAHRARTLSPPP